jgi:ribosome-binding ATPase
MNLSIGLVGLPNVGKSTLFNALVKNGQAEASNYPFCTIDPNVGIVTVPDNRIDTLTSIAKPERVVPAIVEFTDIAGIIKGASQGEGLGNKFLSHIRETAAIVLVARFFDHPDIVHVTGEINPKSDIETVLTELILADLETLTKGKDRHAKAARGGSAESKEALEYCERLLSVLNQGAMANTCPGQSEIERKTLQELQLLTSKPLLIVANLSEDQATVDPQELFTKHDLGSIVPSSDWIIPVSAKLEAELMQLDPDDQQTFLADYGLAESGLHRLVRQTYALLGLQTYFTVGPKEVRAWTTRVGAKAPQAAAEIHTDFEKGFIRAEVIAYSDYASLGSEQACKEAGKLRSEGKEYIVKDGDIMHFRFNV